jgi:uncharacterized PurR-regulated membrane protein YhhQ (DUF165 family)
MKPFGESLLATVIAAVLDSFVFRVIAFAGTGRP